MRYSVIVPALFAASSLAAPAVKYVTDIQVVQVTVTAGTPQASAAAAAQYPHAAPPAAAASPAKHHKKPAHKHHKKPSAAAPAPAPVQTYAPAPAPPAPTSEAPAPVVTYTPAPAAPKPSPSAAPAPSSGSSNGNVPQSGGKSVLDTYNKWRGKYGLAPATWSQDLADNAYLTGKGGNGVEQKHILPTLTKAGSCAQVITPGADEAISGYGDYTPFDIAMLSWLCEKSTDPEIQAECPQAVKANGMTFVDTAHHDDLINPEYTQVGIAFFPNPSPDDSTPWRGLWVASLES